MSESSACLPVRAAWHLSLYPSAGEGGGCFLSPSEHRGPVVAAGSGRDRQRASEEAGRRARARVRRYCTANGLSRLGTLTYEGSGCHDQRQVRADVAEFMRNVRSGLDGAPLPYVWVPEWHHTDHGLHLHFAFGRYVRRNLLVESWGRGFVHIKLLGDLPVGSGPREEARRAAGYPSKYVAKTFTDSHVRDLGLHRYDVAQGFQPPKVTLRGGSLDAVLDRACDHMGGAPAKVWWSGDEPTWDRPPAVWIQWA